MKIITRETIVPTKGNCDIVDITGLLREYLSETRFTEGNSTVFAIGSTAGITTIEYESGLLYDFPKLLDKIVPPFGKYRHNETWGDQNGHSHIRSAIIGSSLCVPFKEGELLLGTWQQVVLMDFDEKPRNRRIVFQLLGE